MYNIDRGDSRSPAPHNSRMNRILYIGIGTREDGAAATLTRLGQEGLGPVMLMLVHMLGALADAIQNICSPLGSVIVPRVVFISGPRCVWGLRERRRSPDRAGSLLRFDTCQWMGVRWIRNMGCG